MSIIYEQFQVGNLPHSDKTLLAFETSHQHFSVALCHHDIIHEYYGEDVKSSAHILTCIDKLLSEQKIEGSDLDAIAFSSGPGSFTGLRMAAATTQGLASAWQVPVIPISSLRALAWCTYQQHEAKKLLCVADAHVGEVFWAIYEQDDNCGMRLKGAEHLCAPNTIQIHEPITGCGMAFEKYNHALAHLTLSAVHLCIPRANHIAQLGLFDYDNRHENAEQALPTYIREKVTR